MLLLVAVALVVIKSIYNLINNNDARSTNDDENKSQSAAVARIQLLSARASSLLGIPMLIGSTQLCAREWHKSKRRCVDAYGADEHIADRLFSSCPYQHQNQCREPPQ